MSRSFLTLTCFALLASFAGSQSRQVEIPKLSTELDAFGARPGTFHFITNEETIANAVELQNAYRALDNLESQIAEIEPAKRAEMSVQAAQLRSFVQRVQKQSSESAGKTAGQVEERLNASKGKFMCGACHGHGMGMMMMHGRGMNRMGPRD